MLRVASLSRANNKGTDRLRGCVGWSTPVIFECNYVRFSLDTALKYDNCHYNNCIVFQCFHTLGRSVYGWHAQRALMMIASINWKSEVVQRKMSQNEKKGTRRKAYSSKKVVRRSPSCRTGDDGLAIHKTISAYPQSNMADVLLWPVTWCSTSRIKCPFPGNFTMPLFWAGGNTTS